MRSVSIHYHVEDGSWWAESPELPGWTAVGDSFDAVRDQALSGVKHFAGEPVDISEVFPQSEAG